MSFVYKCLAVENTKKPILSRCKESPGPNGLLCKKHMNKCKEGPITILMCKEVTKRFKIPFKNQVCVTVNLNKGYENKKPLKNDQDKKKELEKQERLIRTRNKLLDQLKDYSVDKLRELHDYLKLNIWDKNKLNTNPFAFRYFVSKSIVAKLESLSHSGG